MADSKMHLSSFAAPVGASAPSPLAEEAAAAETDLPNVTGRRVSPPSAGFGQLWHKRFEVDLPPSVPPEAVVTEWKANFSRFWPGSSALIARGIEEDEVAGADIEILAGARVAAGLIVLRSEAASFTLMTLQGHLFAGWVRFGAESRDDATVASVDVEMRAADPLYEIGLLLGGHRREEHFWCETLFAVAGHFGVRGPVRVRSELIDSHRRWSRARNVWYNAAIRTQVFRLLAPVRPLHRRSRP